MFHRLKHTAYYIVGFMLAVPMLAVSTLMFDVLFTYIEPAMVWEITLGQMICFFLGIGYVKFNDYLNNRRANHES